MGQAGFFMGLVGDMGHRYGAGISVGATNICVNVRAPTTPAPVCSALPRSAALG